jgi:hypothetical protein
MGHYRTTPTYELPVTVGKNMHTAWWRFFQDTDSGAPPSSELKVTVVASPFIYSAPMKGNLIISGGSVGSILISRSGTFYLTGQTQGLINLAQNDQVKIIHSASPSLVFFPI